jgi:tight adherence protein C
MEPSVIFAIIGVFACVAVITAMLTSTLLERQSAGNRRFKEVMRSVTSRTAASPAATLIGKSNTPTPFVKQLSRFLPKSPKDMNRLQARLATAGLHGPAPLATYLIGEVVLAVVALMIPLTLMGWRKGMLFGVLAAIVGYMIPSFVVGYYVGKRQKQIRNGLPDALDLLIVCLEAGLGIDQAMSKCAEELALAYPALAEELRMVNVEGRAGKPRIEAFKNFADRTKVDDVRALVSMLVQTDRFGTSIAQALRTHADVSRTKRRQRAEERAAKIGVKLVFPLVFCLFPAFYVVTLGPAILKFVEALSPGGALSGG